MRCIAAKRAVLYADSTSDRHPGFTLVAEPSRHPQHKQPSARIDLLMSGSDHTLKTRMSAA